ncbi:unnamed protein product [Clonostachys rhizophaga]|uniref:Peptidase M20 domain-containing protein 2 n=1 Tax=Clonostachys rhizophaga TaxID=160324 RepID=A0A9N9VCY7_9HYPO|nr:unnamed protein product [Clonostachys rhizophaga]
MINYIQVRALVNDHLHELSGVLRSRVNAPLHANPELGYQEHFAHDTITTFLGELQPKVEISKKTYGLETSFEARFGSGGRLVIFCAEYDALPGIGHACGHNLIATSSVAAFLATAHALAQLQIPGRVRLLGTPAEEGGGGKAKLIDAGAFDPPEDVAAAIMAHPVGAHQILAKDDEVGLAAPILVANHKFQVEFHGKTAHAGGEPWEGRNALDAAVSAYNNVALLKKQTRPDDNIHGIIEDGGVAPAIIPGYTRMSWAVRSPTSERSELLAARVKKCMEAGALASGCTVNYIDSPTYQDLRANNTLCQAYVEEMACFGNNVFLKQRMEFPASTDMGNVSYHVPSFHGTFVASTLGVPIHSPKFTAEAATDEAHAAAIECGKGMAMLALRVLADDQVATGAREDFKKS